MGFASFTFDVKRILKKLKGSAQKKLHVNRYGGRSEQEEVCTHPTTNGGQTDGHGNMVDKLFDGHGDTTDDDQTDGYKYFVFG